MEAGQEHAPHPAVNDVSDHEEYTHDVTDDAQADHDRASSYVPLQMRALGSALRGGRATIRTDSRTSGDM